MSFNGNDIVIVRRGEDVDNGDDELVVTVIDENGTPYLLGFDSDDTILKSNGKSTPEIPDGYDIIPTAYQAVNVPNGNWLLLKWLRDNYAFSFDNSTISLLLTDGNYSDSEFITRCNEGILEIKTNQSGDFVWQSIIEDGVYDWPEPGYLNCHGSFVSDIPVQQHYLYVEPIENLAEEESEPNILAGYRLLILALRNLVNVPW